MTCRNTLLSRDRIRALSVTPSRRSFCWRDGCGHRRLWIYRFPPRPERDSLSPQFARNSIYIQTKTTLTPHGERLGGGGGEAAELRVLIGEDV